MKLTEKKLAEFFPINNRFIHYCAKHYNYTFHNDDVVDDARYFSQLNVLNYIRKNGDEFKDEPEMVSIVMSCIRYGILSAYSDRDNRKKKIDSRPFADFEFESKGKGTFNLIDAHLGVDPIEENHYKALLDILVEHRLSEFQKKVLKECMLGEKTVKDFSAEHEVTESAVNNAKYTIKYRFKKLIKKEDEQNNSDQEHLPQVERGVRNNNRHKPESEYENKEYRYLKAMSFLHP